MLGSLLAGAYSGRLDTTGVPATAADTAGDSVVAAHAVAAKLGARRPADSADAAYLHGTSVVHLVVAVTSLVSSLPVGAFLTNLPTESRESTDVAPAPVDA
ncbi:hypothetical protein ACF1BU_02905 [Streptomyces sp. NPDC014724]|uniref:hypothetical protein n=1 Tax=unclassified Streptomyces TaxID=2593676 RepID=UPI0036F7CAD6